MIIKCKDLMDDLMNTVLKRKVISDKWVLDHGNTGNKNYFKDRIKNNSDKPFNEKAITLMLDCFRYHLGLNIQTNNNVPEEKSTMTANNLIDYFNAHDITTLDLHLKNNSNNPKNTELRMVLLSILEIVLYECIDIDDVNTDKINERLIKDIPEITNKINTSINIDKNTDSPLSKLVGLLDSGLLTFKPSRKSKLSIPHHIPSFVGREKFLESMNNKLNTNGYLIIEGIGGIGKSEVVKKYIHMHSNEYEEIIWIDFSNTFKDTICNIPFEEDILKKENETQEEQYNRKLNRLQSFYSGLLLIIDNCDSWDDDFFNITGHEFDVIITTRAHFWPESLYLNELTGDESLVLFRKHCKKYNIPEYDSIIDEILKTIEKHTLLIEMVGKQLQNSNLTPHEILEKLKCNVNIDDDTLVTVRKDNRQCSKKVSQHISSLFEIDEALLSDKELEFILANSTLLPHSGLFEYDFMFLLNLNNNNSINRLADLGWFQIDDIGIVRCHLIIRDTLFKTYISNIHIFEKTLNNSLLLIQKQTDTAYDIQHILSLCDFVINLSNKFYIMTQEWCYALVLFSYYLCEFHRYTDAITVFKKAETILNKTTFDNPVAAPNFFSMGASIYEMAHDFSSAKALQDKAIELFNSIPNKDSIKNINEIQSMIYDTSLTLAYNTGKIDEAQNIYNTYMTSSNISDDTIPGIFIVKGQYNEAMRIAQKQLELTINNTGKTSKFTAAKYNVLGICLAYLHKEKESRNCHETAISILKQLKIEASIENADTYLSYSRSLLILQQNSDAAKLISLAIEIYEKQIEIPCDMLMEAYNISGECLYKLGDLQTAETHLSKAVQICKSMKENAPQPMLANYLYQLAILYEDTNRPVKAVNTYNECCQIIDKITDKTAIFFSIVKPYFSCLNIYILLNKKKEAEKYLNKLDQLFTPQYISDNKTEYILFIAHKMNFNCRENKYDIALKQANSALYFFDQHQADLYQLYEKYNQTIITKFFFLNWKSILLFNLEQYEDCLTSFQNAIKEFQDHPYQPDEDLYHTANIEYEAILLILTNSVPSDCSELLKYESNFTNNIEVKTYNDFIVILGLSKYYKLKGETSKAAYYENYLKNHLEMNKILDFHL